MNMHIKVTHVTQHQHKKNKSIKHIIDFTFKTSLTRPIIVQCNNGIKSIRRVLFKYEKETLFLSFMTSMGN